MVVYTVQSHGGERLETYDSGRCRRDFERGVEDGARANITAVGFCRLGSSITDERGVTPCQLPIAGLEQAPSLERLPRHRPRVQINFELLRLLHAGERLFHATNHT